MTNQVLVVFYNGQPANSTVLAEAVAALASGLAIPSKEVKVIQMSEEDIAQAVCGFTIAKYTDIPNITQYTPEENALIYIGEKFKKQLAKECDFMTFVAEFSAYMTSIAFTHADPEMEKAVKIIAHTKVLRVRDDIRSKYRISNRVIELIARVGNHV